MSDIEKRFILIHRRTRLDELIARHNTLEQARFYIEQLGGDFDDFVLESEIQKRVISNAKRQLKSLGRLQLLERSFLPNYLFGADDIVVVIGQDGLVANTMKYLDGHPVVAINPDPARYEGVLIPFDADEMGAIIEETATDKRPLQQITLAEAKLSDGQELLAVNDFFIGPARHTTAAYTLSHNDRQELQMSSGVIVSTGLGSSGWVRSIYAGAEGLLDREPSVDEMPTMAWDSRWLIYAVREPYRGGAVNTQMVHGRVNNGNPLILESAMPEEGIIFSDGMLNDAIQFNAGSTVTIGVAEKSGRLVI